MNLMKKFAMALAVSSVAFGQAASAQQVIGFQPGVGQICSGPLGPGPCPLVWQYIQTHQGGFGGFNPAPMPVPAPAPSNGGSNGGGFQLPQLPTLSQDGQILQQGAPVVTALCSIFC